MRRGRVHSNRLELTGSRDHDNSARIGRLSGMTAMDKLDRDWAINKQGQPAANSAHTRDRMQT